MKSLINFILFFVILFFVIFIAINNTTKINDIIIYKNNLEISEYLINNGFKEGDKVYINTRMYLISPTGLILIK